MSRRFGRPSPVRAYWLTRCEGFQLRCRDGTNGVVEEVLLDPCSTEAHALVVRIGRVRHRSVVISAEQVDAVAPFEEVLVGSGLTPEHAPSHVDVFRARSRATAAAFVRGVDSCMCIGLTLLQWLAARARVTTPAVARLAWSAATTAGRLARVGWRHAQPRLFESARWVTMGLGLIAAAVALLAATAARRLARAAQPRPDRTRR